MMIFNKNKKIINNKLMFNNYYRNNKNIFNN